MRIFFQITTWLFMPILMPIYAQLLVMYVPSQPFNLSEDNSLFIFSNQNKVAILSNYILFTVIAPAIMYSIFLKLKIIKVLKIHYKCRNIKIEELYTFKYNNIIIKCLILLFYFLLYLVQYI